MKINPKDISYEYSTIGYMMFYKGKPIGGAGIDKNEKGCVSNLKLFKREAELTRLRLCQGYGDQFMYEQIKKIESEE